MEIQQQQYSGLVSSLSQRTPEVTSSGKAQRPSTPQSRGITLADFGNSFSIYTTNKFLNSFVSKASKTLTLDGDSYSKELLTKGRDPFTMNKLALQGNFYGLLKV